MDDLGYLGVPPFQETPICLPPSLLRPSLRAVITCRILQETLAKVYPFQETCISVYPHLSPSSFGTARVGQVLRVVILDARDGGIQQPAEERIVLQGEGGVGPHPRLMAFRWLIPSP